MVAELAGNVCPQKFFYTYYDYLFYEQLYYERGYYVAIM